MGTLYYGENLDILRWYVKDESVDLVYLDPPFNSAQNYNAFFQEKDGAAAASQIRAFEDTWHRNVESERAYQEWDFAAAPDAELAACLLYEYARESPSIRQALDGPAPGKVYREMCAH
jgi:hypothetical protein